MSKNTADLLREYGAALRGYWGDIDGRSERRALDSLAGLIDLRGSSPLSDEEVLSARDTLGVCQSGLGHWRDYCDDDCNEANS